MEAPIVANFADLVSLQIVVVVDQGIHIAMQALQIVDRWCVELDFYKIFGIRTDDKVYIVPIRQE